MNIIWIRIISWNDRNNTEYKGNDRYNTEYKGNDRNNTEYKGNDIIMLNNRKAEELS